MATFAKERNRFLSSLICITVTMGSAIADNREYLSKKTKDICNSVQNITALSLDMPDAATKKSLANCDPYTFYYGYGNVPEYSKAKTCALVKNDYGVLMMLYANGKAVPRDLNLALHYACIMDAAPAETEGRVAHLYAMKENPKAEKAFDLCDDITSGYMMGVCENIEQEQVQAQQKKYLDHFKTKLSPAENKALEILQKTSALYFKAHQDNELDWHGTAAAASAIAENIALNKQMLTLIHRSEQCQFPAYTPAQYQNADDQLNSLYKKTQAKPFSNDVTITSKGIKETERLWLNYRDAWVNFGHLKCPNVSAERWKTLITKERIKQLKELIRFTDI